MPTRAGNVMVCATAAGQTSKDLVTGVAATYSTSPEVAPATVAVMVQVPGRVGVIRHVVATDRLTVQMVGVVVVRLTARPESALGVMSWDCDVRTRAGWPKVIVWSCSRGSTAKLIVAVCGAHSSLWSLGSTPPAWVAVTRQVP